MNSSEGIMVSVCMITYNHEKYIGQAIEGVLQQKCNFPIELVIGEDCSTDGTRKICEDYQRNSSIIRLLPSDANMGVIPNFIRTLTSCKGKYIAFCEGDDYWIDPFKLQKQVDFLEKNQEYSMVATNLVFYDQEKDSFITPPKIKHELNFDTLISKRNKIATVTVCFRAEFVSNYLNDINPQNKPWFAVDYSLWLYLSKKGKIGLLKDVTAVYRRLKKSLSHYDDINLQYNFYKNNNEIVDFYIRKYGCKEDTLYAFKMHKFNLEINYAFSLRDKKMMRELLGQKKENNFRITFKQYIKFLILQLNIYHLIVK